MKTKMIRFMGLFLCCVMLLGLLPVVSYAAGEGYTKDNPVRVTDYAGLKAALENPQICYVEVAAGTRISEGVSVLVNNGPLITINGLKVLTVNGSVTLFAGVSMSDYKAARSMLAVYGAGNYLDIEGSGSLTFEANAPNSMNAVVELDNKGTLSVDGDVTLTGSYNNQVYGTAIRNEGGTVQIHGGTFIGELADSSSGGWGGAVMTAPGSQTFIRNATLRSVKQRGEGDEPVICATVYVAENAYVLIENSTIETTKYAANGYSIYVDDTAQNVSKCLYDGQKLYRLSDNVQLNANASAVSESVFVARALPNEISSVELVANDINIGTLVSDMGLVSNSRDVGVDKYYIYEGLDQTGTGTALQSSAELKPQREYSAIYELTAIAGKYFVNDLTADDIKLKNGYVTDVRLSTDTRTARVFVNFPKNARAITELSFEIPEIGADTTVDDMRITVFPRDKVIFSLFLVYSGLKHSGGQLAAQAVLDPADDHSALYQFTADGPYFFADDITPKDITITNGVVTAVNLYNENKTVEIYVDFPKSSTISRLTLGTQKITKTTTAGDMQITEFPDDKVYWDYYLVFEYLNKTEDNYSTRLPDDTVLNPQYDYSAFYQVQTREGKTFAEDFSKDNITFKNGEVWKIELLNNNTTMLVYVNFPKIDPNITSVSFNVKKPVPGEALDESYTPVSDEPDRYVLYDFDWYISENGVSKHLYKWDRFEIEKKYTLLFRILPADEENTKFVYEKTTVKINGYNATIVHLAPSGDGIIAQYTFTTPKNIKMSFDPNGGTGTQEPVNVDEYDDVIMPECTFTKDGDSFHAWNVGGTLCYPGDPCNISQNTTATAVWSSELTKDVAVTMSTISEGNTPADIVFGPAESKFTVSAVWYRGDSIDKFKRLSSTDRLSVDENYTVQLTINSADFLAAIDELNVTLNGKKMKNILSRKQKQVILNVQILNDVDVEFFEPMDGVPLATSVEMKPNSGRFFVSSAFWYSNPDASLKDKLDSGTEAKLGKPYYLRLDLRSDAENQIFGGDTIKMNGKAYPVTSRGGFPTVDYIKSNPVFIATYPRVKISENADGSILVEASKDMKITFAAALYDSKGRMIEVLIKPDVEFSKGSKSITFFDILGNKSGKFLLGTSGYKVKFMAFENINNMTPIGNALIYKYRL